MIPIVDMVVQTPPPGDQFAEYIYSNINEFVKTEIKSCGHCNGTGLFNKSDMNDFCDECHGVGFTGFDHLGNDFVCRSCNGIGCKKCEEKGIVDWIAHAMGSDLGEGKEEKSAGQ